MLAINWDDVAKVVSTIIPHIVAIVIALVAAIVVTVAAMKAPKGAKGLIRGSAWVAALLAVLAQDPRPQYQDDPERVYGMAFAGLEVKFRVAGERLTVMEIV